MTPHINKFYVSVSGIIPPLDATSTTDELRIPIAVNYFSTVYFHFACRILVEFLVPENIHTPLPRRTIVL